MLKDPAVRAEHERLNREKFAILDEIFAARREAGLTQAQIAQRMGSACRRTSGKRLGQRQTFAQPEHLAQICRRSEQARRGAFGLEDRCVATDTAHEKEAPGWSPFLFVPTPDCYSRKTIATLALMSRMKSGFTETPLTCIFDYSSQPPQNVLGGERSSHLTG